MSLDWWNFWNDERGFNIRAFSKHYQATRVAAGYNTVSNTRLRFNRLRESGLNCLETNVHTNERPGGHGDGSRSNDFLAKLVQAMPKLDAVIAHGAVAGRFMTKFALPANVQKYELRHFRMESYRSIDLVAQHILSRAWERPI
jgi:hypothetical protein